MSARGAAVNDVTRSPGDAMQEAGGRVLRPSSPVRPAHFGDDHMSEGTLLPLGDGRILLAFRLDPGVEGNHTGERGQIVRSVYDPRADTWSPIEKVYDSGRFDDRNVHGGVTREGRLVLFMRHLGGKRYFLHSTDDGETWSELQVSEVWSDPKTSGIPGVWSTGRMFYNPDIDQYMMLGCRRYVTFSEEGTRWETLRKLTDSDEYKLREVAGAWCGQHRVVALIRDDRRAYGHPLVQLVSRDNGKTWTEPRPTTMPPDRHWGCAPQLLYDDTRGLLIAMTSTRYGVPNGEQALYVYTAAPEDVMENPAGWRLQFSLPRPWATDARPDNRPLNQNFYGYPTIAALGDGEYLVVFTERAAMRGTEQADLYYFRMRFR